MTACSCPAHCAAHQSSPGYSTPCGAKCAAELCVNRNLGQQLCMAVAQTQQAGDPWTTCLWARWTRTVVSRQIELGTAAAASERSGTQPMRASRPSTSLQVAGVTGQNLNSRTELTALLMSGVGACKSRKILTTSRTISCLTAAVRVSAELWAKQTNPRGRSSPSS